MNRKREVLEAVLARSWAWIQLDGRGAGVELPDWLRLPSVTLQLGYDMPVPIADLVIDDAGVGATLSFRRTPYACRLPWAAIFAIADLDGLGALFPEDVPADLPAPSAAAPPPAPAAAASDATPDRMKSGRPRPSHLKLV